MKREGPACPMDLSLATSDELWEELRGRFGTCVFVWARDTMNAKDYQEVSDCWYSGGLFACAGLAHMAATELTFKSTPNGRVKLGES